MVWKLDLLEFALEFVTGLGSRQRASVMPRVLDPFRFVLICIAGWMNQRQLHIIDYLREENLVLREQPSGRRVRFNDNQRRRVAAKAEGLGRRILAEVATIVTVRGRSGLRFCAIGFRCRTDRVLRFE